MTPPNRARPADAATPAFYACAALRNLASPTLRPIKNPDHLPAQTIIRLSEESRNVPGPSGKTAIAVRLQLDLQSGVFPRPLCGLSPLRRSRTRPLSELRL